MKTLDHSYRLPDGSMLRLRIATLADMTTVTVNLFDGLYIVQIYQSHVEC